MASLWHNLIQTYADTSIEAPALKLVTLAQWALESGYGSSHLATEHLNFGGLKFRARVNQGREDNPLAVPVDYVAHDGEDTYCKFSSIEDFIAGYWAFIDNGSMYDGWRTYASEPNGYIGHLFRSGYAQDPDYVSKVRNLLPRMRSAVQDLGLAEAFPAVEVSFPRVAVLVGHNSHSKGAFSPHLSVHEWDYNKRVANAMVDRALEFELEPKVFYREYNSGGYGDEITAAYAEIDAWKPAVILELHFNAFNGNASGTEVLYLHDSNRGKALADAVQSALVSNLRLPDRGSKGRSGGRGSASLEASDHPTILTEPFFGDNSVDCERMLELGEKGLARAYLIGVRDALA